MRIMKIEPRYISDLYDTAMCVKTTKKKKRINKCYIVEDENDFQTIESIFGRKKNISNTVAATIGIFSNFTQSAH